MFALRHRDCLATLEGVKVFAHRGASTQYAEHTRAAFAHALAVGADGIETDVQLSADDHLICWHDATLDRTSTGRGPIRAHRLAQLRKLDVHSWKTSTSSNYISLPSAYGSARDQLVTLDELTDMAISAGRAVELAVEMKSTASNSGMLEHAVLEWLQRWGWNATTGTLHPNGAPSQVSVSVMSFSRDALRRVAALVPPSRMCVLFDVHDRRARSLGARSQGDDEAELLGPSVGWLTNHESTLRSWTRAGRIVRMWTVATEQQLHAARMVGVQQITVNDPQWALQQLR